LLALLVGKSCFPIKVEMQVWGSAWLRI
jgi:hypothetical protein